ncbi:unnamed protein product [Protopolystoma xenopodis]|uniref:Uncharacterized protein n=1 Tax=Protopolystoma xenopodis TaxID=117903 RepID=A0A448XEM4_9PLAT|nr:unnamed protein product [Protopolystoma xenopodis]
MSPSSNDVRHITNEISVRIRAKRCGMSRGLHQPERIKAKRLQYNANSPTSPGEIDLRISSSCTFIRNESLHINFFVYSYFFLVFVHSHLTFSEPSSLPGYTSPNCVESLRAPAFPASWPVFIWRTVIVQPVCSIAFAIAHLVPDVIWPLYDPRIAPSMQLLRQTLQEFAVWIKTTIVSGCQKARILCCAIATTIFVWLQVGTN